MSEVISKVDLSFVNLPAGAPYVIAFWATTEIGAFIWSAIF